MKHPNYKKATNAAYNTLLGLTHTRFATDVLAVVDEMLPNCKTMTYGQACFMCGYDRSILESASEYGFSLVNKDKRFILYNELVPMGCARFTLAHEIGHAVLEHRNEKDDSAEKEANCFARNLLCPVPVADLLGIDTWEDYTRVFDVSPKAAKVAIEWAKSDRYYIEARSGSELWERTEAYIFGYDNPDEYYYKMAASM